MSLNSDWPLYFISLNSDWLHMLCPSILIGRSLLELIVSPRLPSHHPRLLTYSLVSLFAGNLLSMGYGFVEYKKRSDALRAITELQVC